MAGYEVTRFIGEVDEEFICSICAMVLKDAVQTQCDHLFCSDCIKDWLQIRSSCPLDQSLLDFDDLKPAARFFRNLLDKLQIKCDFEFKGCESVVKLEHLQNHTDICVYNPNSEIICDKGCNLRMRRCDYAANNCFTHFADRINSQNEQITELKGIITDLREQINRIPVKWLRLENAKLFTTDPNTLVVVSNNCTAFAKSFDALVPGSSFKIQILVWAEDAWIAIGLTPRNIHTLRPGWVDGSIGYSSYGTLEIGKKSRKIGENWKCGDVVECGIRLSQNVNMTIVFLSKNGQLVTENSLEVRDSLFPTICFCNTKIKYRINQGSSI